MHCKFGSPTLNHFAVYRELAKELFLIVNALIISLACLTMVKKVILNKKRTQRNQEEKSRPYMRTLVSTDMFNFWDCFFFFNLIHTDSPVKKKFQVQQSVKVMLTVFCDMKRLITIDFLKKVATVLPTDNSFSKICIIYWMTLVFILSIVAIYILCKYQLLLNLGLKCTSCDLNLHNQ